MPSRTAKARTAVPGRKPAPKAPAARSAKPAPTVPAPAAASVPAAKKSRKADKPPKPGKPQKPVRDSFTMPPADFALIGMLKERALAGKREAKKSELLRAGLHALAQLDPAALVAALGRLAPVKVGRPKNG